MIATLANKTPYLDVEKDERINISMSKKTLFFLILFQIFVVLLFFILGLLTSFFFTETETTTTHTTKNFEPTYGDFKIPNPAKGQSDDSIIKELNKNL